MNYAKMKIPHVKNAGKTRYVKMPIYGLGLFELPISPLAALILRTSKAVALGPALRCPTFISFLARVNLSEVHFFF